ncbi:Protein of the SUN family [Blumeria graminis f. sp. tritici 96224]|uniref:Protein of the SUN family n=1 Tax=Blumeria graminis f. sp. tritici 96224 TaxID=1268274 RepID=A0A656KMH2_BLUGR|nr:Protein of the SUN family [Blumeria graminis f. sp. tritici 96224]
MKLSCLAIITTACLSAAQPHNHRHRHMARHGSRIEARDTATSVQVEAAMVTVYELNGQKISSNDVDSCLKENKCVVLGAGSSSTESQEDLNTFPAPDQDNSSPEDSPSTEDNASPEEPSNLEPPVPVPSTPEPPKPEPPTTDHRTQPPSGKPEVSPKTAEPAPELKVMPLPVTPPLNSVGMKSDANISQSDGIDNSAFSGSGIDSTNMHAVGRLFPSGKVDCSEFPSKYGAVPADWIQLNGWTGVQKTSEYNTAAKAISHIETAVAGEGCVPGSFCSYACPAGFQKSQWPSAQGATGQSIGGLYCNTNGKLELSRSAAPNLCTPGVGDVKVRNSHSKNVAICRTDYPGTEAETIALNALPGSTVKVTCPDSKEYYRTQDDGPTSAQYYINPSGYDVKDACTWGTAGSNLGNWAPVNMGVGKGDSGSTFISLFPNAPTNPNGVLDFNIDIKGDVTGSCSYRNGKYYKDGVESPTGCTVSLPHVGVMGGATFEFS